MYEAIMSVVVQTTHSHRATACRPLAIFTSPGTIVPADTLEVDHIIMLGIPISKHDEFFFWPKIFIFLGVHQFQFKL